MLNLRKEYFSKEKVNVVRKKDILDSEFIKLKDKYVRKEILRNTGIRLKK